MRTSIPDGTHGGCEQGPTSFGLLFAKGSALNLECPECLLPLWTRALQCSVVSLVKPRNCRVANVPFCPICQLRIVDRLFSHFFAVYQSATGIPHLIEVSVSRPSQTEIKLKRGDCKSLCAERKTLIKRFSQHSIPEADQGWQKISTVLGHNPHRIPTHSFKCIGQHSLRQIPHTGN